LGKVPCDVSICGVNVRPSINASIGIAIFPKDGATSDMLVKSADRAMYRAKQSKSGYAFAGWRTRLRKLSRTFQIFAK
jgi:diguanylate cyclase